MPPAAARRIATMVLVAVLLPPLRAGAAAPGQPQAPSGSARRDAYRSLREASGEEERLRREVLDAAVRLHRARQEADRLAREAAAAAAELAAARQRGEEIRQRLAAQRQRVNRWLRFLHEHGPLGYLDVLLGATDFNDFTTRLEVLSRLVEHNVELLRGLRVLQEEARRREAELAARRQALAGLADRRRLAALLLARRHAEKEAALDRARQVLGERAAALAELDRRWAEALPDLAYLLANLPDLPWGHLEPESVRYDLLAGTARAEVSEAALNRILRADPRLAGLRLRLLPGQVVLEGEDGGGFTLAGTLSPADGRVAFVPVGLEFEGVPVGAAALRELTVAYDLSFDLSRSTGFLRPRGVEVTEGRLILRLGR